MNVSPKAALTLAPSAGDLLLLKRSPKVEATAETPDALDAQDTAAADDEADKDVDVEQFSDAGDISTEREQQASPPLSLLSDGEGSSKNGDLDDVDADADADADDRSVGKAKSKSKKNGSGSGGGGSSAVSHLVKPRCNCDQLMAVDCHLETKELWDKFHELGTEMIITKTGR